MKLIISTLIFSLCFSLQAQEKYARVAIDITTTPIAVMQQWGIGLDHFHIEKNKLIVELSETELKELQNHSVSYRTLIADMQTYYQQQNQQKSTTATAGNCSGVSPWDHYITPTNFTLGSMAGYYTYSEFLAHLDNMATLYPNLITVKQPIDTFLTHENRPLYWLKISDNPNVDESEPKVLYTALHHAREPASLSQLIFYMYYVLENYATNPQIKALVDSTELYFVPMINPDGYVHNQTIAPAGGGMWRKNRRNNLDGTFGVDLNRNYAYEWGGLGASANTNSDTYRGPSGFSEPETQAIKFFMQSHAFLFTLNYHTFSNLLLYPYGYDYNEYTPDDDYFKAFTPIMVSENGYANINAFDLYAASGDSDDWMYADSSKPKVFAMTPEVGSQDEGFWPPSSRILQLCKENVLANIMVAQLSHAYAYITDKSPTIINTQQTYLPFEIQCLGLDTPSSFSVSYTALSSNITTISSTQSFNNMYLMDVLMDSVFLELSSTILNGDQIQFLRTIDFGFYTQSDTVTKTYYNYAPVIFDSCSTMSNWVSSTWGNTSVQYHSPSTSIGDSPVGNYIANQDNTITFANTIDLTTAESAFVTFYATWDVEEDYDYVQFEVSTDGGSSWIPLCGEYTNTGTFNQDEGNPVYDGVSDWVFETVSLNEYLGEDIKLQFQLASDPFQEGDGFYFDDFAVNYVNSTGVKSLVKKDNIAVIYPNPSKGNFSIKGLPSDDYQVSVRDLLGKEVLSIHHNSLQNIPLTLKTGVYLVHVDNKQGQRYVAKLLVE
jgi:carboxypeptidase T